MKNKEIYNYLKTWSEKYKTDLIDNILPFWLENGLDKKHGGFYTCLDRNGTLMDTTKSVWFQGRAGYIFASSYNEIDPNPAYLSASRSAIDFLENHCFDTDGRMYFEVEENGTPLRKRRYLFSECFAVIAMAEYSKATQDKTYSKKALEIFKLILKYSQTDGLLQPKYEPTLKAKGHSLTMMLVNVAVVLRSAIADEVLDKTIQNSIQQIREDFMHPEYKALLETVGLNGEFIDTGIGRTINPGHCIETAWFLLEEAKHQNWNKELIDISLQIFDWSWDWGYDKQYGGIINFKDCKNFPHQDYSQDMKFWWPQTETIIATLYNFLITGNEDYFNKYKEINEWTYKHFPDDKFGEWYGYLHRDGSVAQPAKGNIFKGPFHIPRMMIKSHLLINDILQKMEK